MMFRQPFVFKMCTIVCFCLLVKLPLSKLCRLMSFPYPKEETLARHSILGPNGLHGQWTGPVSGIKVWFSCYHLLHVLVRGSHHVEFLSYGFLYCLLQVQYPSNVELTQSVSTR
jgi:hypothetical protein